MVHGAFIARRHPDPAGPCHARPGGGPGKGSGRAAGRLRTGVRKAPTTRMRRTARPAVRRPCWSAPPATTSRRRRKPADPAPRCGRRLYGRKPLAVSATLALALAAALLYVPSNLYPMATLPVGLQSMQYTVLEGVIDLWDAGLYSLAALVFSASFAIPGGQAGGAGLVPAVGAAAFEPTSGGQDARPPRGRGDRALVDGRPLRDRLLRAGDAVTTRCCTAVPKRQRRCLPPS